MFVLFLNRIILSQQQTTGQTYRSHKNKVKRRDVTKVNGDYFRHSVMWRIVIFSSSRQQRQHVVDVMSVEKDVVTRRYHNKLVTCEKFMMSLQKTDRYDLGHTR